MLSVVLVKIDINVIRAGRIYLFDELVRCGNSTIFLTDLLHYGDIRLLCFDLLFFFLNSRGEVMFLFVLFTDVADLEHIKSASL